LGDDCLVAYGHRVVAVETFTDPTRHTGACYAATNFMPLGQTLGYGRSGGTYVHHGNRKMYWLRPLRADATRLLRGDFDHPVLHGTRRGPMIDLDTINFASLRSHLEIQLADWRKPRGVRYNHAALFTIATAAVLSGARSVVAIGEFAKDQSQTALGRLGARCKDGVYIAPHADTFRRALANVDVEALDRVIGDWLGTHLPRGLRAVAFDGKTVRGAYGSDGTQLHLLSAMVHAEGAVLAQQRVPTDKTNEITQVRPLLERLDLKGVVVTADALHTQRGHAHFLVTEKGAGYVFIVKNNQPTLAAAIEDCFAGPLPEAHTSHLSVEKGHGRKETRRVTVIAAPDGLFPHAAQIVEIERSVENLDGTHRHHETVHAVTSLKPERADAEVIGILVRGHWGIENRLHWVRDVTYDEDRSQLRTASAPHAMASLRNLSIGLLRLAGVANIASALRWVGRRPERALALLGL
jgi:predicted transposase YbfD/YdcC